MKKIFTLLTIIVATVGFANAQTNYVTWNFVTSITSANYSTNTTNQLAARSTALTNPTISNITITGTGVSGTAANTFHRSTGWPLAQDNAKYLEFSVTLGAGQTFPNSAFSLAIAAGVSSTTTAARSYTVQFGWGPSPVFTTVSGTNTAAANTTGGTVTSMLTGQNTNTATIDAPGNTSSTLLTIRLVAYAIAGAGTGNIQFGSIALTSADAPLPISLVKFTADKLSEKVKLNWVTATEINNDKFVVERSADGENFELVSEIKGAGNSREINSYDVVDANPLKGTSYYRLTQVDFNGASETFAPVAVNMSGKLHLATVQSNTEAGNIDLNIYSPSATSTAIRITDLSGRTIASQQVNLVEGYQSVNINTSNLSSGIHIIQIMNGEEVVMKKLVL